MKCIFAQISEYSPMDEEYRSAGLLHVIAKWPYIETRLFLFSFLSDSALRLTHPFLYFLTPHRLFSPSDFPPASHPWPCLWRNAPSSVRLALPPSSHHLYDFPPPLRQPRRMSGRSALIREQQHHSHSLMPGTSRTQSRAEAKYNVTTDCTFSSSFLSSLL